MSDTAKTTEIRAGVASIPHLTDLSAVPYLDQYAGAWAIDEGTFAILMQRAQSMDIAAHLNSMAAVQARELTAESLIRVSGGVGVLNLQGVLMKQASSMTGGTSTVLARRALRMLLSDDQVENIVLKIESPGGTAAGTAELADDIRAAKDVKPVVAYIEDLGASAAYWLASQASEIYANKPAKIGSIGAYMVVHDLSGRAEKEGVKVHVIKAEGGTYKGMGVPGTEITQEDLSDLQRIINGVNSFFLEAVSRGRSMNLDTVKTLADGRVHFATEAVQLGLIDGVESFEATLARVRGQSTNSKNNRSRRMSTENQATAATVAEIKASCPGINSDKVLEYAEASKTLEQCKDSWLQDLATDNAALQEQNTELQEKLTKAEAEAKAQADSSIGVDPLAHNPSNSTSSGGSATEQFHSLVREKVAQGLDRRKATTSVVRANPDLHKQMLAEANA